MTTLIDIPDDQLSEAEKKEKRKQKLMKANYDARQRAKMAKEEAKLREVIAVILTIGLQQQY